MLVLLAALGAAPPALAAQAAPSSVEDLARASDVVVRARVAKTSARLSDDGKRIFTYAEVEPSATWRGRAAGRITVLVPGGVVGRMGQRVDGAPAFTPGEEAVVFLHAAETGLYRVTGLAQGKFNVAGASAAPDLSHTTFVAAQLRPGERRSEAMPVGELERRVRSVR